MRVGVYFLESERNHTTHVQVCSPFIIPTSTVKIPVAGLYRLVLVFSGIPLLTSNIERTSEQAQFQFSWQEQGGRQDLKYSSHSIDRSTRDWCPAVWSLFFDTAGSRQYSCVLAYQTTSTIAFLLFLCQFLELVITCPRFAEISQAEPTLSILSS